MASKAGIGLGTTLSIGTGTGTPETFVLVGEVKSLTQNGRTVATEDVTNMQSTAREFIPTLVDSGTWDVTGNYVGSDVGQQAMETAFSTLVNHNFKVQLPKAAGQTNTGDTFSFTALIQDLNYSIGVDKAVSFNARLKVSGPVNRTPGS